MRVASVLRLSDSCHVPRREKACPDLHPTFRRPSIVGPYYVVHPTHHIHMEPNVLRNLVHICMAVNLGIHLCVQ